MAKKKQAQVTTEELSTWLKYILQVELPTTDEEVATLKRLSKMKLTLGEISTLVMKINDINVKMLYNMARLLVKKGLITEEELMEEVGLALAPTEEELKVQLQAVNDNHEEVEPNE